MSDPLSPVRRVDLERRAGRRASDPRLADAAPEIVEPMPSLPVPVSPPPELHSTAEFEAQLLGQPGQRRGLRGGQPVLEHARHAYLEAEWSGPADRRPPQGRLAKTTI